MKKQSKHTQQCLFPIMLLILGLTISHQVTGQMMYRGETITQPPQTWSFVKYGNTPVSYYTGTVQVDIPIYTYKDNDFELPISISYASNGLRPNDRTGILGSGWFFNVGGVITREVNGIPDDASSVWIDDYFAMAGYYHLLKAGINNFALSLCGFGQSLTFLGANTRTETQPDIFHFNIMGLRGSFVLGPNGNHHIFNTNFPRGEIKIDTWGDLHEFIITTSDGYKYRFRENEPYVDFSTEANDPVELGKASWFLSRIEAPNKREIVFHWSDSREFESIGLNPAGVQGSEGYVGEYFRLPLGNGSFIGGIGEFDVALKRRYTKNQYLNQIVIDNFVIDMNYTTKYAVEEASIENTDFTIMNKLDSIRIYEKTGSISRDVKSVKFHLTQNNAAKTCFLEHMDLSGEGRYSFEYNTNSLPKLGTYQIDYWGYYNANPYISRANFIPTVHVNTSYDEQILIHYREPNANAAKLGMLCTVKYPTGGRTEFEYEGHDYNQMVVQNSSTYFAPGLIDINDKANAGGVRIKKITDYAANDISTSREFFYEISNGKSSGILLNTPRYSLNFKVNYTLDFGSGRTANYTHTLDKITTVNPIATTIDKTHIEYKRVVEKRSDNSSIEYCYYTYQDAPDDTLYDDPIKEVAKILDPAPKSLSNLTRPKNSRHNFRGILKSKQVFDNLSNPLLLETYDYHFPTSYIEYYDLAIADIYRHKIYTGQMQPYRIRRMEYFGTNSIQNDTYYTYNSLGQCIEERRLNSQGDTVRLRRQYAHDVTSSVPQFVTEMKNSNVIRYPLKEITTLQQPSEGEMLIGGNKYLYKLGTSSDSSFIVPNAVQSVAISIPQLLPSDKFNIESYVANDITYQTHDKYGNLIHSIARDTTSTTYIWGYNGLHLVAIVQNKEPLNISSISGLSGIATTPLTGALSGIQESALRNLPGSLVTTYTYKPFVGVTSITDPSGRITYYNYDSLGRLESLQNDEGKLVEHYEYHYKN